MKKTLFLAILLTFLNNVFGQKLFRDIDTKIRAIEPVSIPFIKCPTLLPFKIMVTNQGPDTIFKNDKLRCYVGSTVDTIFDLEKQLFPFDSIEFEFSLPLIDYLFDNNEFQLMLTFTFYNDLAGSIKSETGPKGLNNIIIYKNIVIRTSTSSIQDQKTSSQLSFFPNPVENKINFHNAHKNSNPIWVEITDVHGKTISSLYLKDSLQNIDISYLRKGIYFIRSFEPNLAFTHKFIKL